MVSEKKPFIVFLLWTLVIIPVRAGHTAEACAVFEMNTEAFPESWNVWGSLGKAAFRSGDDSRSEELFKKPLSLNPGNTNARNNLSRIKGGPIDARKETRAGTNFCPSISPDGKYLFYASYRDIYWVSTEVIHRLKPKTKDILEEIQ